MQKSVPWVGVTIVGGVRDGFRVTGSSMGGRVESGAEAEAGTGMREGAGVPFSFSFADMHGKCCDGRG